MRALIIGCGRLGAELAYRLYQRGHEVSLLDLDEKAFEILPADFQGRFHEGNALNYDVLRRCGIEEMDSVAVLTNSDVVNGVVGYLAVKQFHVPNVVVRNYDPRYRPILEAYGLQMVSALSWGAQRVEEMMYHAEVRAVFSAGNGEVEVYEVLVPEHCHGKLLKEVVNASMCVPVAVTRAGKATLPDWNMRLEAGDVLHLSATLEGAEAIRQEMLRKEEK